MSIETLKSQLVAIAVVAPPATPAATAVPDAPAQTAAPAPLVAETVHVVKGYDLDVTVPPARVADAARMIDAAGFMIEAVTGVDWMAEGQFEIVYDFTDVKTGKRLALRARVPRAEPALPTICSVFPGANWHERETHDFFGVTFTGHPDMSPLILPEDADFHPLRKDYGA